SPSAIRKVVKQKKLRNRVIEACEKGLLNKQELFHLLNPLVNNNVPASCYALQGNHTEAVKANCEMILTAREKGWIDDAQFEALLNPMGQNNSRGFSVSPQGNNRAACKEQGRAIIQAYARGWLTKTQIERIEPEEHWLRKNGATEYMAAQLANDITAKVNQSSANIPIPPHSVAEETAQPLLPVNIMFQKLSNICIDLTKHPLDINRQIQVRQNLLKIQENLNIFLDKSPEMEKRHSASLHVMQHASKNTSRARQIVTSDYPYQLRWWKIALNAFSDKAYSIGVIVHAAK
ncbi:MAG: hypothetical protein V4568_08495, partial [Pseudomonadota bacterium]